MRISLHKIVLMALVINGSWCLAQPVVTRGEDHIQFQHITAADGLSDNGVTCIFEDRDGYIWIGTERGLNRYDGQRVEAFPPGATGPRGNHLTAIAQDHLSRIWVSTVDGGLSVREPVSGAFTHYRMDGPEGHRLPTDVLNHVLVANDSLLILSSRNMGALWFNMRTGNSVPHAFSHVIVDAMGDTIAQSYNAWCHMAVRLDERKLWSPMIGGTGSYIMDLLTGERIASIPRNTRAPEMMITNGLRVGDMLYAAGWTPGIVSISLSEGYETGFIPLNDEVTAMVPWNNGDLLAATKLNGLLLIDPDHGIVQRWQHVRTEHASLINDRVRCLLRDRSGNLWVGTAEGLAVFAPAVWPFSIIPLERDEEPGDIAFHKLQQDDDGTLRISTSRGFYLVNPSDNKLRHVALKNHGVTLEPTGLFRLKDGSAFIGTETGLFRYDPTYERLSEDRSGTFLRYQDKRMFQVRSVFLDTLPEGPRLVVGVLGNSHSIVDPVKGIRYEHAPFFSISKEAGMLIRNTIRDERGKYWMATANGLVCAVPEKPGQSATVEVFATDIAGKRHLASNDVSAVLLTGDTVWAALRDAGLVRVIGGRAESFTPPDHIPKDARGIAADTRGHIWYTTSNGLVRFDPLSMEWLHVPVNDGHDFRLLNTCILKLFDGRIAFCAERHLITFDPKVFDDLPEIPQPMIKAVKNTWGILSMTADGVVEIPYRNSAFDALISALQPTATAPLEFVYRLEGVDADDRIASAREAIRYAGVPTGTHRLLVRTRDSYGREGPESSLLTINVLAPFWQRWWFYAALITLGAIAMWLIGRFREQQTMRLQSMRDHIARDLHDDVGSTLGSISFYSEALKRKLDGIDDPMAKDVASRIGNSSRDMIDRMADIVWSVDPKNDDAGSLIERMKGYASDLVATRGIEIKWNTPSSLEHIKLGTDHRRNLFMIFKEAVYNSVKYAACKQIDVSLNIMDRKVELVVSDNGKGFDPENVDSYNGNGLPGMQTRAKAMGGQVCIESSPDRGTTVRALIPISAALPRSGD